MDINVNDIDVRLAAAGDRQAFDRLYQMYRDRLIRFAAKQVGADNAEDIVSETFLTAFERLGELKDPSAFGAWLYSVAYRKCADLIRREKRQAPADGGLAEAVMLTEDYTEHKELISQVRDCIDGMKPGMRAAVILYYYEERSVSEVAKELGIRENTAKQRLFQARKRLKRQLTAAGSVLAAVPLGALLECAFDSSAASAAAGAAKAGAAVGKGAFAAKLIGGAAAVMIAVGVPLGIYLGSDKQLGEHRDDSSAIVREDSSQEDTLPPDSEDSSVSAAPFFLIPAGTAGFAMLIYFAVKTGAVDKRRFIKAGLITGAAMGLGFFIFRGSLISHNPLTGIAAHIAVGCGFDRPIQVQSYPERVYIIPEGYSGAKWAIDLGMMPRRGEAAENRFDAYSDDKYRFDCFPDQNFIIVSHAEAYGVYDVSGSIDRAISEVSAKELNDYLPNENIKELTKAGCDIVPQLEELVREGGLRGEVAAKVLEWMTQAEQAYPTLWNSDWETAEEFLEQWEMLKSSIKDTSVRLDLPVQIGSCAAAAAWLLYRIARKRRKE